jgi:type 2 lantibiotic biosynthesis protein LanM
VTENTVAQAVPGLADSAAFLAFALVNVPEEGVAPTADDAGTLAELAHPLRPFVDATRLVAGAHATVEGVDFDRVWPGVAATLAERIAQLAGQVVVEELNRQALPGTDGRDRFVRFLTTLSRRAELAALLDRYPVLAQLLAVECLGTATALVELLDRFAADHAAIDENLLPGLTTLTGVRFEAGDRHAGHRTVAMLEFTDGRTLVYKPRPLALHERWNGLLAWFRGLRPDLAPRAVTLLARDGYGWMEFIAPQPCADVADVEAFYRRQGALLVLCYALDAIDMHCENVIAAGAHPVLVDVETLFHPAWRPNTDTGDDPALAALNDSVARTGMLPWRIVGPAGALDVSAFGAGTDQTAPHPVPEWVDLGTDTVRLVHRAKPYAGSRNRPVLQDAPVDPLDYGDHLQAGFVAAYRTVLANAAELIGPDGLLATFAGLPIRVVVRASHLYGRMLADARTPELLSDPAKHAAAFADLDAVPGFPHLAVLAAHERADLMRGDLPLFTGRADERTLTAADGATVAVALPASGLEAAVAKVARMNAADLRTQQWLISASLVTMTDAAVEPAAPRAVTPRPLDTARILALACRIGDELCAAAASDRDRVNWLGLEPREADRWVVAQLGAGLADGYPGTALFLAQLGAITGLERYTTVAARAARPLRGLIGALAEHPVLATEVGPGAFYGVGGILYATVRLAELLDDDELRACVPLALTALAATVDDPEPGIGYGLAGALMVLLAIADPAAAGLAATFADRLAAAQPVADNGFLHGSTGIRWALGRAPEHVAATPGWANGLAGTTAAALGTPEESAVAQRFLRTVRETTAIGEHSLHAGAFGVLDVLLELERAGNTDASRALTAFGGRLLGAVEQHGARCGTPNGVSTPSLLHGTAGIGYGLLRLAHPARVPSILLLQNEERKETGHGQRTH